MMSKVRYNFIIPRESGLSLEELRKGITDGPSLLFTRGEFIWGYQTYRILKDFGLPVELSQDWDPAVINLAHGNVLRALDRRDDCFHVSLQADFPHFQLAQYHIVQNQEQVAGNAAFIPHWPQPGQVPRDPNRTEVRKAAYQGAGDFTDIDEGRLNADLEKYGMEFEILDEDRWASLQEIDVLVGVRSFGRKKYKRKPPTKLIDAWHAGIPFIGGWDSAYTQVGEVEEDYLQICSYEELRDSIIQLKDNPRVFNNMIKVGRARAAEYTVEAIAKRWKLLLENEVTQAYLTWQRTPHRKLIYRVKQLEYEADKLLRQMIQLGYRIPAFKRIRDQYYDPVK